jgi:hypothetical protein
MIFGSCCLVAKSRHTALSFTARIAAAGPIPSEASSGLSAC